MKEPLSIHLDNEHVILRQLGEEEPEPATLSGQVILDLSERCDIKDLKSVRPWASIKRQAGGSSTADARLSFAIFLLPTIRTA